MKKLSLLFSLLLSFPILFAQNYNIEKLGELKFDSKLSAIWGFEDKTGKEYAIVGLRTGGVAIVDVSNPALPREVFRSSGPPSTWREMKVYNNHAYIVTEQFGGGLQIIDLSTLPENTNLAVSNFTENGRWSTAHTVWIDQDTGLMYIFGANKLGQKLGVIIYDLKPNPKIPTLVKDYVTPYNHDGYAKDGRLYLSHVYDGFFSIHDLSDIQNPVELGRQDTPLRFTHNAWPSDDHKYVFTTDEKPNSHLTAYDISDPQNITELDRIQTAPGSNAIIHNTHIKGDYAISAYYVEGVTIHDVSDPANLVEVGKFDTSPFSGNTFNGVWEVYPFGKSGNFLAGDIEEGLFVLKPTYRKASRLQGTVTDIATGDTLVNVKVSMSGVSTIDSTNIKGAFKIGTGKFGKYTITLKKEGYQDKIVNLNFEEGVNNKLDFQMLPVGFSSFNAGGFYLASNPIGDELKLVFDLIDSTEHTITLVNMNGKRVFEAKLTPNENVYKIPTVNLEPGVYNLQVFKSGVAYNELVVKL